MTLHVENIRMEARIDPRDLRIEQLAAMIGECRDMLQRLTAAGAGRLDLIVQVQLLTTDLVETRRQLQIAKRKAAA